MLSFSAAFKTIYIVDFDKMVQINSDTKVERKIRWRSCGRPAFWECKLGENWVPYSTADAQSLSVLYDKAPNDKADIVLRFSNQPYTIDFARMVQINRDTKVERPIRATPAHGAPKRTQVWQTFASASGFHTPTSLFAQRIAPYGCWQCVLRQSLFSERSIAHTDTNAPQLPPKPTLSASQ